MNNARALLRHEFSFYADDRVLHEILLDIADKGVTIIAFTITTMDMRNVNFVRMVVGPASSNSSFANMVARDALQSAGVRYHEEKVIQIIAAPSPGFGLSIFQSLSSVRLNATYTGVNSIILNVSDTQTALTLLKKNNIIS